MHPAKLQIDRGTCYVFLAYDVGFSIDLDAAERLITGGGAQRRFIQPKRRAPRFFEFDPPPLEYTQAMKLVEIAGYITTDSVTLMIYDFGAVSVRYSLPLAGPLDGLLRLSDRVYDNEMLLESSRRSVEHLLGAIRPAVSKPVISPIVEDYTIYEIESVSPHAEPQEILDRTGDLWARILRAESESLSSQETQDALSCRISFGERDLTVVDWNAAVIFDVDPADVRTVLEYANVELLEMRYLDNRLDDVLDESYEALLNHNWRRWFEVGSRATELRRVAELQMDSALLFEGVNNALKLLGDQYLARVYRTASHRLHLGDWDASILRKLQVLESIYQKISDHQAQWRMEVAEWIIILLIAVSIAISLFVGGH